MKLRYVTIGMDYRMKAIKGRIYASHFNYHVYFISYCLSKKVRQLKFETDETFGEIIIFIGSESTQTEIIKEPYMPYPTLDVHMPFDSERYENGDRTQRCEYYMELLRTGLRKAAEVKPIPYEELMAFADELEANGYVYEWDFRSILVREYGLRVKFVCRLDTDAFTMNLLAFIKRNPEPVCSGQVVRAMPDAIHFDGISKKIYVENNRLVLQDKFGDDLLYIDIKSLLDGHLKTEFASSPYLDDKEASDTFYYLQERFKYDNNDFISHTK